MKKDERKKEKPTRLGIEGIMKKRWKSESQKDTFQENQNKIFRGIKNQGNRIY